jgi:hypothetical protein
MDCHISQGERGFPRLRQAAAWPGRAPATLVLTVMLAACGSQAAEGPERAHGAGAEHEAEMARDAEAALQQSLASVRDKPPVITLDEVARVVGADSSTRTRLDRPVAALNAALVQLAELHRAHDSAAATDAKHELDRRAYPLHMQADAYESEIDRALSADQHQRFHAYLRERTAAAGLPADASHGPGDIGTAGNTNTVAHPGREGHDSAGGGPGAAAPAHAHPDSISRRRVP